MRSLVRMFVRIAFVMAVVFVGLADGLNAQVIGWGLTVWVLYRAAPGLWSDVKRIWFVGKNLSDSKFAGFRAKEDIGV